MNTQYYGYAGGAIPPTYICTCMFMYVYSKAGKQYCTEGQSIETTCILVYISSSCVAIYTDQWYAHTCTCTYMYVSKCTHTFISVYIHVHCTCTIAFIFVDLHSYSVHTMYVNASLFVIYMYMSMWPSISHCSKWSPPSGKSISAGSCAGNHVVVAVGNELYCLDIQPSDLTELRLVYTETSEPLTHSNMVQNACSRYSELKFRLESGVWSEITCTYTDSLIGCISCYKCWWSHSVSLTLRCSVSH